MGRFVDFEAPSASNMLCQIFLRYFWGTPAFGTSKVKGICLPCILSFEPAGLPTL